MGDQLPDVPLLARRGQGQLVVAYGDDRRVGLLDALLEDPDRLVVLGVI
jgi:hypothetical protein